MSWVSGGLLAVIPVLVQGYGVQCSASEGEWKFSAASASVFAEYLDEASGFGFHFSCLKGRELEIAVSHIHLSQYSVRLSVEADGHTDGASAEEIATYCSSGLCDLRWAEGGAAGLAARILKATQIQVRWGLGSEENVYRNYLVPVAEDVRAQLREVAAACEVH